MKYVAPVEAKAAPEGVMSVMRERDLQGHIKSPQENGIKAAEPKPEPKKDESDEALPDNQIKSAIDILKSWEIFKKALK